MRRPSPALWNLLLALALSACGITATTPSPVPSPAATTQPSSPPQPGGAAGSCPSAEAAAPDAVDPWSPPPEAASITPLSCDAIGEVFAYDPGAPLDIQEVGSRQDDGVTLVDLTYASPMGGRVPATLVVPDGAGPFAGMLLQHGMPSTRQPLIPAAADYARMGAVVLLIDAPFARRSNGLSAPTTMTEQDRREQIQLIVDLRRGIDLLISRPDVDPERLAYVGVSYGGAMGGLLAGVEDRVKAYVLQVGDGGLVTHSTGPEDRASWLAMPEDLRRRWVDGMWPIEPIHYVGCASPAALLFQNGTVDTLVPPADAQRYQEAGSEPKTTCWYQAGHPLNATADQDRVAWLGEMIGISVEEMGIPVDPQVLAAYAGRYQVSGGVVVTIRVDGDRIYAQVPDGPEYQLYAVSDNLFRVLFSDLEITFSRNDRGEVDRFVGVAPGETIEARKVP